MIHAEQGGRRYKDCAQLTEVGFMPSACQGTGLGKIGGEQMRRHPIHISVPLEVSGSMDRLPRRGRRSNNGHEKTDSFGT